MGGLRDGDELELARRRAAQFEYLAATWPRTRGQRYEARCDRGSKEN